MIIKDITNQAAVSRDSEGYKAERAFMVTDVSGNPDQKLFIAMTTGGIPQYGDPHPSIPDLQVTSIRSTPQSGASSVKVVVSYSVPGPDEQSEIESEDEDTTGQLVMNSSLTSEVVFRDVNGELLKADYYASTGLGFEIQQKYEEADVQKPQLSVTFSRTEAAIPKARIRNYLGKVNSVSWSGFPPKTWLCSGITARENKNKFDVEYQFTYRPDTWRLEIVVGISQEEANEFPIDVDSGNGYAVFDVYETIDFNALGLNF